LLTYSVAHLLTYLPLTPSLSPSLPHSLRRAENATFDVAGHVLTGHSAKQCKTHDTDPRSTSIRRDNMKRHSTMINNSPQCVTVCLSANLAAHMLKTCRQTRWYTPLYTIYHYNPLYTHMCGFVFWDGNFGHSLAPEKSIAFNVCNIFQLII
jgi:hypothetical protein